MNSSEIHRKIITNVIGKCDFLKQKMYMKYYLPLLFFSFCFLNCGRDNSDSEELIQEDFYIKKRKNPCDWCKSELPDNAFCYYDEVIFSSKSGDGVYDLDSIYFDRSPLPRYYVLSDDKKNWKKLHPFKSRKYTLSTLLLNTNVVEGPVFLNSPNDFVLKLKTSYSFCSIKCVKNFNENVKFSKPLNSKFEFTNNDN